MKLVGVAVKNFRSYKVEQGEKKFSMGVGDGLNLLVGPNNCGKSNLLRAIAIALEDIEGTDFDRAADIPDQLAWATPVITLIFRADRSTSVDRTLLRHLQVYEESANPQSDTNAEKHLVKFRVKYTKSGGRDEFFLVRGAGNRRGDSDELEKCLKQFRKCVRFIYLRSGESLSNFVAGAFRELLNTVLRETLHDKVEDAEKKRRNYIEGVRDALLDPLGQHAASELQKALPEIQNVSILPFAPGLNEALAQAEIRIEDTVDTAMLNKGTGVRGALLVALLSYLAENSRRSVVFAVEEPESFLHPAAQRELRRDLKRIAEMNDVTLLATTHSPFLLDRSDATSITPFTKADDGTTTIGNTVSGSEPLRGAVEELFGEAVTPCVLDEIQEFASSAEAILVVEGYTDKFYLERAAEVAGREELTESIEIRSCRGAKDASVQAILLDRLLDSDKVGILLDWDDEGKHAEDHVKSFCSGRVATETYRKWRQLNPSDVPVEAEDMFGNLVESFLNEHGDGYMAEKAQFKNGTWHYGLTEPGKDMFMPWVDERLSSAEVARFIKILEFWNDKLGT